MIGSLLFPMRCSPAHSTRRVARLRTRLIAWVTAPLLLSVGIHASAAGSAELKINRAKAAFTLNIAKFVTWPDHHTITRPHSLKLCFYRSDQLSKAFEIIQGKRVGHREISQSMVVESIPQSLHCDLLFVPSSDVDHFMHEAQQSAPASVLTIADATNEPEAGIAREGVVVSLVRKQASMGLEINLAEAQSKGLKLSSELLKLARIINGDAS